MHTIIWRPHGSGELADKYSCYSAILALDRYPGRVLLRANAHLTLALGLDGSAGEPKTIHQHASQAAGLYAEAGGSPYEAQARALAERTAPQ